MPRPARAYTLAALLLAAAPLFAQYGPIIDRAAAGDGVSIGASIMLLGVASGSLAPEAGLADARATLSRLGFRLPRGEDEAPIRWGDFSYLLVQLFDLRGDLSYGLFPGPRSALRLLERRGLLAPNALPSRFLSGPDALLVLRRFEEGEKPAAAAKGAAK